MKKFQKYFLLLLLFPLVIFGYQYFTYIKKSPTSTLNTPGIYDPTVLKTDQQWRQILTPRQYYILRQAGTEAPFTGKLEYEHRVGTYYSVGCNEPIFRSEQKFESGTGWPSFWAPITPDSLVLKVDNTLGVSRTEVLDKCGSHLGHVFDDGPPPTGKRYCMNSEAMYFIPDK